MNAADARSVDALWYIAAIVLALSALTARQLSIGAVLKSLVAWLLIAGLAWAVIARRNDVERIVGDIGDRLGLAEQRVEGETVRISMSTDGHFYARAHINGRPLRLLIDSGATLTALSEETANAVGVRSGSDPFPVVIRTANGTVAARRAKVDHLRVGSLEMRELAVVVSPAFGDVDVIGMNFLSRLGSWRVEGRTLILEPKRVGSIAAGAERAASLPSLESALSFT